MSEITVEKLVKAYTEYLKDGNDSWHAISSKNHEYLYTKNVGDYNQESFKTLIESIELNGLTNFNMTTFIGNIGDYLDFYEGSLIHEIPVNKSTASGKAFDQTTNAFNCNSVGCIAGFAVANAVNWNQPKWLTDDSRNHIEFFEHVACNWLNIPIQAGRSLFYGDSGSVWSFVRYFEPNNYGQIEWTNQCDSFDYSTADECDEEEWFCSETEIELSSINYKYATDVLSRVVAGQIIISNDNDFSPRYSESYKKTMGVGK